MLRQQQETRLRHDEAVYGALWKRGIQRRTNRNDERVLWPGRQAGYDENDGIHGEVWLQTLVNNLAFQRPGYQCHVFFYQFAASDILGSHRLLCVVFVNPGGRPGANSWALAGDLDIFDCCVHPVCRCLYHAHRVLPS